VAIQSTVKRRSTVQEFWWSFPLKWAGQETLWVSQGVRYYHCNPHIWGGVKLILCRLVWKTRGGFTKNPNWNSFGFFAGEKGQVKFKRLDASWLGGVEGLSSWPLFLLWRSYHLLGIDQEPSYPLCPCAIPPTCEGGVQCPRKSKQSRAGVIVCFVDSSELDRRNK